MSKPYEWMDAFGSWVNVIDWLEWSDYYYYFFSTHIFLLLWFRFDDMRVWHVTIYTDISCLNEWKYWLKRWIVLGCSAQMDKKKDRSVESNVIWFFFSLKIVDVDYRVKQSEKCHILVKNTIYFFYKIYLFYWISYKVKQSHKFFAEKKNFFQVKFWKFWL